MNVQADRRRLLRATYRTSEAEGRGLYVNVTDVPCAGVNIMTFLDCYAKGIAGICFPTPMPQPPPYVLVLTRYVPTRPTPYYALDALY